MYWHIPSVLSDAIKLRKMRNEQTERAIRSLKDERDEIEAAINKRNTIKILVKILDRWPIYLSAVIIIFLADYLLLKSWESEHFVSWIIIINLILFFIISLTIFSFTFTNVTTLAFDILKMVVLVLLFMYLFELGVWITTPDEGLTIQPFEVVGLNNNISGTSIASLLSYELQSISVTDRRMNDSDLNEMMSVLVDVPRIHSESIKYSLINLGSVGMGGSSFSMGQLTLSIKQLLKTQPVMIKGNVNKYDSILYMIVAMEKPNSSDLRVWAASNVSNATDFDDCIPSMVKDIAFQIALDDAETTEKSNTSFPRTWQTFKYLIEGQKAYLSYLDTGDEDHLVSASNMYTQALDAEPNYNKTDKLLYRVGLAYYGRFEDHKDKYNHDKSRDIFKQLKDRKSFEGTTALGLLYLEDGDYDNAIETFNESLALQPESQIAWCNKGTSLYKKGELLYNDNNPAYRDLYNRAGICYDIALGIDENYTSALNYKGLIFLASENYSEAIELFRKAHNESAIAWFYEGRALREQAKTENNTTIKKVIIDNAIKCLSTYRNLAPTDTTVSNELGILYYDLNDYSNSTKEFEKYTRHNAKDPVGWCSKGRSLIHLNRCNEALYALNESIYWKNNSLAWIYKSKALAKLGLCDKAEQAYNISIELDPDVLKSSYYEGHIPNTC